MAPDQAFFGLFSDVDLLIVVDEWRGARLSSEPEFFLGRGFTNTGRTTRALYRLLATNGAADWHARVDRNTGQSLFTSPAFGDVLAELGSADTCLYEHLYHDLEHFEKGGAADPNWRRITLANDGLGEVWKQDAPRHARALFWFVEVLLRVLARRIGRGVRIRVVVDRQDWLGKRAARFERFPGLGFLGGRDDAIRAEVVAILDKQDPGVLPYLPLLGLVDSETWAFGKQFGLLLPDGSRAHDRCLEWLKAGRGDSTRLLQELNEAFDRAYGHLANLNAYLHEAWTTWAPERRVDLDFALEDSHNRDPVRSAV